MNWEIQKNLINLIVHGFVTMFWLICMAGISGSCDKSILGFIAFLACAFGAIMQLIVFIAHMDGLANAMKAYEKFLEKESKK